jgi:hypothetical protein
MSHHWIGCNGAVIQGEVLGHGLKAVRADAEGSKEERVCACRQEEEKQGQQMSQPYIVNMAVLVIVCKSNETGQTCKNDIGHKR